jgi:hypothetical protein
VVPESNDFSTVKLCPGANELENQIPPVFDTNGWGEWKVDDKINIEGCDWQALNANQCYNLDFLKQYYPDQFHVKCIKDMPPTRRFDYVTRVPVNNKWSWDEDGLTLVSAHGAAAHSLVALLWSLTAGGALR